MKLLNLGCGGERWDCPLWTHLDDLHEQFPPGTPERAQIDASANYINFSMGKGKLPFPDNTFSAILANHVFEHFHAQDAMTIMEDCRRILAPGGFLVVSVPNATYFRSVYAEDSNENWPVLFGVSDPPNPIPTWHEAALWYVQHAQIFTEDSLWSHFVRAGFPSDNIRIVGWGDTAYRDNLVLREVTAKLNRRQFSLEMWAQKPE